jgi:hypothetical protein
MLIRSVVPALLGVCSVACGGTPQTDPIMGAPPELHGDLVLRVPSTVRSATTVELEGQPGSAAPAGGVVHIVDLDGTAPPVEATVRDDGSFQVTIDMESGDVLRFDVRNGTERSEPVDMVVGTESLSPAQPSLACWTISGLLLTLGEAGDVVRIENDCDESLRLSRVALRVQNANFTIGSVPADVPSGSKAEIAVGYASASSEPDEEILLVEIDAPVQDRRAVTLVGVAQE